MLMRKIEAVAPVRKTAAELDIAQDIYDALLWVRDGLATGRLVYLDLGTEYIPDQDTCEPPKTNGFNMSRWHCRTACCIGGWVRCQVGHVTGTDRSRGLNRLFYPDVAAYSYSKITPAQAACAIDNYLQTGEPKWPAVLGVEECTLLALALALALGE